MERTRRGSDPAHATHPIGTPKTGLSPNTGPLAAASWLTARELIPDSQRWAVQIAFDVDGAAEFDSAGASTRFELEIYSEEWGYKFRHGGKESWIRVTDIAFVHGRDDHGLLRLTPKLRDIGNLVRRIEEQFGVVLPRESALIRTTLRDAEPVVRAWAREL